MPLQQSGRWHALYSTARWQRLRRHQLISFPLCAMCLRNGRPTPATVVDHVQPHNGDVNKFYLDALQSLCAPCHDRDKKRVELWGYGSDVGKDGWPIDPNHPANR